MAARQRRKLRREESSLQLTDDQVNELKDCFEFFDKTKSVMMIVAIAIISYYKTHWLQRKLSKSDLKNILGELGLKCDVDEMFKEADSSKQGHITFPMFLSMMSSRMMQVDNEDNLVGAFKIFDPDITGYIDADKLKQALTSIGEPLTAVEWAELKENCVKGGQVDYMVFVNTLFAKKL